MKLRLFLLAICSTLVFFAKAATGEPDYIQRLDRIEVKDKSMVVFNYENDQTLVSKDSYVWKNSTWVIETSTVYTYTSGKVSGMKIYKYDSNGNSTMQTVEFGTYEGSTIDQIIENINKQSGGENSRPVTGGWVD